MLAEKQSQKNINKTLPIMKQISLTNLLFRSVFALALASTALSPLLAQPSAPASGSMMTSGMMAEQHQAMQEQHAKMMAEMKAQDTELNAQLARIKSAPEKQKVDLLVAVVARMVEQRTSMHTRMDGMMNQMMGAMPMDPASMQSHGMMNGMGNKPAGMMEKQK